MTPCCLTLSIRALRPLGSESDSAVCFELTLDPPGWAEWRPGQFVMLRPECWGNELLWARPFSISRVDEQGLHLFFQVVGRGTGRLAGLPPGAPVTVWGPLGTSFVCEPDTPTLLLAGGVGLAPFIGYAARHPRPENLRLLFGHRLPLDCYPWARFDKALQCVSYREKGPDGLATFIRLLRSTVERQAGGLLLACGPTPFLRTVSALASEFGCRAQLSLENRMACGVGACLGCVTPDTRGWPLQVCTHGPVFWADTIDLNAKG